MKIKQVGASRVLYVMAAEPEFGLHLKKRIAPLMTGVGPVEAAIVLSSTLAGLEAQAVLPDWVVSLGSAGSATLEQAEIYQVSKVFYRDMDASALGFEKYATPLLDIPAVMRLPCLLQDVPAASLATGASIVSGKAYEAIPADMVDMESYAVLRACQRFKVPMIGLRGISDGDEDLGHIDDWTECLHIIDEKLASAVDQLEAVISDGKA